MCAGSGVAVQLIKESSQKLQCRTPTVRAVSTDWYRYPSVLTANPLFEKGRERTTRRENRTAHRRKREKGNEKENEAKKACLCLSV